MSKYFRDTQCQSKEERKLDKYQEIRRSIYNVSSSEELRIRFSRLQLTSSTTVDLQKFMAYCQAKLSYNSLAYPI